MKNAFVAFALLFVAAAATAAPETVMLTYRPTAGNETKLQQVIADHWSTVTKLGLAAPDSPHVLVRNGKTFVEIFTWKDDAIPDNAPPEIMKIWGEMMKLVEKKDGMRIDEVELMR